MGEADPGTLHLPRAGFAAQLGDDLHNLAEMRCADRLALADEAAAHVHRMLAGALGDALVDQAPALADRAHLQVLLYLQLPNGVGNRTTTRLNSQHSSATHMPPSALTKK